MKRILALVALAFLAFPMLSYADPVRLYRESLIWRKSQTLLVGAYADSGVFNHATGASTVDTSKAISIRCMRPKADLLAVGTATDSLLWMRVVLFPTSGRNHAMAVAPTISLQTLITPHVGAVAAVNGTATAMTQGITAYTVADTAWSKSYSYGTLLAVIDLSTASYCRVLVTSSMIGEFTGYVEYFSACPQLTEGSQ